MAIYEEVICCKQCGKRKPHTEFGVQKRWSETHGVITHHLNSRTCKSCTKHNQKVIKRLEKEFPYPTHEVCDSCGTDFTYHPKRRKRYLFLDHDHKTDKFRAYLCESCNTGTGKMGDTYEEIVRRASFLNRTEELQNKHRRKDYQPNNNEVKVKPKQVIKDMSVKYHNLVRYCIDQQDLDYATKVVDLIGNEFSVKVTESTSPSSSETTIEKRRKRKERFINSWKPFNSTKNLVEGSVVFELKQPMTIVNRKEETFNEYVNSGIFYKNPNGTQNFLVDVDKLNLIKVKV